VKLTAVTDARGLAVAERIIVDGFPQPHAQPWVEGRTLPPRVLELPGWQVWLARREGVPAAAGYTFDDGAAVGVYWLATLSGHRSAGLGRAVLTAMLAAHPDRTATLVATDSGVPLYTSMGFTPVATATWYIRGR
jgi:GNAT superfamily N-acetyltransferase